MSRTRSSWHGAGTKHGKEGGPSGHTWTWTPTAGDDQGQALQSRARKSAKCTVYSTAQQSSYVTGYEYNSLASCAAAEQSPAVSDKSA
ncbi:hypothetical protein V493_05136 [Pseudogymnoascus sp. VKM F-4281 (FW-2241)]|nr:hypothetical protein V493_05136 [Pseudogymnoascus sp. VKM F-4281 (FW-2241)]